MTILDIFKTTTTPFPLSTALSTAVQDGFHLDPRLRRPVQVRRRDLPPHPPRLGVPARGHPDRRPPPRVPFPLRPAALRTARCYRRRQTWKGEGKSRENIFFWGGGRKGFERGKGGVRWGQMGDGTVQLRGVPYHFMCLHFYNLESISL